MQGRERAYAANGWVELPELIVQASERLRGVSSKHPFLPLFRLEIHPQDLFPPSGKLVGRHCRLLMPVLQRPELIVQASERLRGVQIEQRPAVELISRFNSPNRCIVHRPRQPLRILSDALKQVDHVTVQIVYCLTECADLL